MDCKKVIRKLITAILFMCFVGSLLSSVTVRAAEDLEVATECLFVVPPEFEPGRELGFFEHLNMPMESSSIRYNVYSNGKDKVLTNREKKLAEEAGGKVILDESQNLTKEIFEESLSNAYNEKYGADVGYKVSSFENIKIDGFKGYRIGATFQASGEERVYQTTYIILSKYKTFTITYQRAEDDDCQELFDMSEKTIHIR